MAEIPRLGPESAGLAPARHRRGPRRLRGGRQHLAGPRPRPRTRGAAGATRCGSPRQALARPKAIDPGIPLARAGGVWLPGPGLDLHRIAKVIEWEFGVRYHKDHVGRLLKDLHWTPQQPIRRAIQRDEEAIRRWRDETWPELLRRARRERRTLVFEDESGFYLLPGVVKTYAPEGLTPILREKQTRDHLSVMGAMTPEGRIFTMARQESINGLDCIEFLLHLLRVAGERLLVIWDGRRSIDGCRSRSSW